MTATHDQWLEAFGAAYDAVPDPIDLPCPNCGHHRLNLVFTGDREELVGYAAFWCDNCLQGIVTSRTIIPEQSVIRDIHLPADQREPKIPNFQIAG
ncbi:hypothetical protein AB0C07_27680 [Actinoplanes missouriensis]|uniref:hypothetical protein n=1 Tax=Actinoplanes missouriensis TaxID=1866 RepID=UPI0033FC6C4E